MCDFVYGTCYLVLTTCIRVSGKTPQYLVYMCFYENLIFNRFEDILFDSQIGNSSPYTIFDSEWSLSRFIHFSLAKNLASSHRSLFPLESVNAVLFCQENKNSNFSPFFLTLSYQLCLASVFQIVTKTVHIQDIFYPPYTYNQPTD
jgi:hypothetical protein